LISRECPTTLQEILGWYPSRAHPRDEGGETGFGGSPENNHPAPNIDPLSAFNLVVIHTMALLHLLLPHLLLLEWTMGLLNVIAARRYLSMSATTACMCAILTAA
jgi:hypothetical protein